METKHPPPATRRDDAKVTACVQCESTDLVDGTTEDTWTYGELALVVPLPAQVCRSCGESYVWGNDLRDAERRISRELVARGADHPTALRSLRKDAELRVGEFADLLGVAPEVVSAWESGERPIERAHLAILGQLVVDALEGRTTTRDQLQGLAQARAKGVARLEAAQSTR